MVQGFTLKVVAIAKTLCHGFRNGPNVGSTLERSHPLPGKELYGRCRVRRKPVIRFPDIEW
jgi:hypothetical protein